LKLKVVKCRQKQNERNEDSHYMQNIHVVTTRFNTDTWNENSEYRKRIREFETKEEDGAGTGAGAGAGTGEPCKLTRCIYGAPQKLTEKIGNNELVFVVEMNNTINKVEGVGLIRNQVLNKTDNAFYYRVYKNGNYNRYIYKSAYHLDRKTLETLCERLVVILDFICFKGKTHLKRGSGFTRIPDKLYKYKICEGFNMKSMLREVFKTYYTSKKVV